MSKTILLAKTTSTITRGKPAQFATINVTDPQALVDQMTERFCKAWGRGLPVRFVIEDMLVDMKFIKRLKRPKTKKVKPEHTCSADHIGDLAPQS